MARAKEKLSELLGKLHSEKGKSRWILFLRNFACLRDPKENFSWLFTHFTSSSSLVRLVLDRRKRQIAEENVQPFKWDHMKSREAIIDFTRE